MASLIMHCYDSYIFGHSYPESVFNYDHAAGRNFDITGSMSEAEIKQVL